MRKLLLIAALVSGFWSPTLGQLRYQQQVNTTGVPSPVVRVCSEPASGSPCTPLVSLFSDKALGVPLTDPFTGDSQGNYYFYVNSTTTCTVTTACHIQIFQNGILIFEQPDVVLASGGGGGGGGTPQGPNTGIQANDNNSFYSDSFFTYTKGPHTVGLPDASTWSPTGITAPSNALIVLDGNYGNPHATGFMLANSAGTIALAPSLSPGTTGGGYIAIGGHTAPNSSHDYATMVSYNGSGADVQLTMQIGTFADTLNYTYSGGGLGVGNESGVNGSMFGIDRNNKSTHLFGAVYLPNAAGTGASAGAIGSVMVSGGAGGVEKHSSDLVGPFELVGSYGSLTNPGGGQSGIGFGPGGAVQCWDATNTLTWKNCVLSNNVPAAGITGLVTPSQIDLSNPAGLGGNFAALNAVAQYNIAEWGATGVGPITGPLNDAADNILSTTKLINLATFTLGRAMPNCAATGTTINKLAKMVVVAGATCAVITATTDAQGEIGVVVGRAGTTGSAVVSNIGETSLVMDGPTTANDVVIISPTVAGDGSDTGSATCPTSGAQVVGRVLTTNGATGTYAVLLGGCDTTGSGGGGGLADPVPAVNGIVVRTALNTTVARSLAAGSANIVITNPDGTSANPTVDIGTGVATLTATQILTNKNLLDATDTVNLACAPQGPLSPITQTASVIPVYSCTIPGGTLGTNKCIHAHVGWQHSTGSASVTYNFSYGGTAFSNATSSSVAMSFADFYLCANGGTAAQYGSIGPATAGTTIMTFGNGTSAIDDTVNQTLLFTSNAAGTEVITPKIFVVDLIH